MFRFEHPQYLYYLFGVIPLLILLYASWIWYRKQEARIGDVTLVQQLNIHHHPQIRRWTQILSLLIFLTLVIAWANPQWGAKRQKVKARSTDIFIALDISNSMFSEDVAPSRMEVAKKFAFDLIDKLKGERIGLIVFAGNAYLQMPLTRDYAAAQVFVKAANPGLAANQGTALSEAIQTAEEGFGEESKLHKSLIIISDGEDHDADAIAAAANAHSNGMLIFTVGIGTEQGSFIPIIVRGARDWKRDASGQPIQTKMNEGLLRDVAQQGGGQFFRLNGTSAVINALEERIDNLEKEEFEERSFAEYESFFQWFLGMAILLILLQWVLDNRLWKKISAYV
ncbi:MAG: VWA domain-containing protein [Saprospiraceae bacterium]|nr:VWA domain-containing protein [Saprospiraceae bacterium]